jgi:hypothetical protein
MPGETIALAFDAVQPTHWMSDGFGHPWFQPTTRYAELGVHNSVPWGDRAHEKRERVTLAQLRALAALPPTDTTTPAESRLDDTTWLPWLAGGLAFAVAAMRPSLRRRPR